MRIVFAVVVAVRAFVSAPAVVVQRPPLVAAAVLSRVPLLDRLLPAAHYRGPRRDARVALESAALPSP